MTKRTLFALLAATLAAGPAAAQSPPCNALKDASNNPLPPPIYISGSTALEPMLKTIGPQLASQASGPLTVVYLKDGSCSGVNRIFTDGLIKQNMFYIPPGYSAMATPTPPTCTVDPTVGQPGDLVLSDVDPSLCPTAPTRPANITDFNGPVNSMVMVVPSTSTQTAITAEDAYLVFGMGTPGGVAPWLDPLFYFIRPNDSGTRAMIAANIGVGKHDWQGVFSANGKNFGSGDVFNNVAAQQTVQPEKTIGILGEDYYDQGNNRASVKALAFRAFKQKRAYSPDSSATARDKQNVRDGHYKIWGYVHMLTATSGGVPMSANAKAFIDLIQGKTQGSGFDVQDAITDSHLVPLCAMHVTHDIEAGDQKPYSAAAPCDCSFIARATGNATPTGCTPCNAGACSTGVCRKNFCEAK
jgi:ABC-type phosphate transport system substrate-binding protein